MAANVDTVDLALVGVVVIGRNEGTRLGECLDSVRWTRRIVYADSSSSDGSPSLAAAHGAEVLPLSADRPFTAARGRHEGLKRLLQLWPETGIVLFVDGDCVVETGWLAPALQRLEAESDLAVVCGFRREAFPEKFVYHRIMDMEWAAPAGDVDACGGDALMKVSLILDAGGFNAEVVAGEEPELCFRIRRLGYRICRIPMAMTIHDARMTTIRQWCRREWRSGFGAYEVWKRCGGSQDAPFSQLVRSAAIWGLFLPAAVMVITTGLLFVHLTSGLLVAAGAAGLYSLQACRIIRLGRRRRLSWRDSVVYGVISMIGKFCQAAGMVTAWLTRPGHAERRPAARPMAAQDKG